MTENTKTITFVAIGLCAILLGIATRPSSAEVDDASLSGKNLTKDFTNPEAAKRLRIVRFDEDTAELREFEVAEHDGLWSIPSKDNYPADAKTQMAEASTSLMDRKILHVQSKLAGDHEQYGVVDPLSSKLEPGQKGVGMRVTMSDEQNKPLADLIVGKAVRDAEGQRYVRKAGQDVVYVIEIDPAKLSTSFEDWIEKDLLKLNAWDLKQVEVKDYSAELVQGVTPDGRLAIGIDRHDNSDMTFSYNDAEAKWMPVKLKKFEGKTPQDGKYVDFTLAKDEELNETTLNGLKTALDDLKIVDVVHKPQGLSNDLKAGADFVNSREAQIDLMTKGFTAVPPSEKGGDGDILSSDGEVVATMKNGAEYVLRFGKFTDIGGQDKQDKDKDDKSAAAADAKKGGDKNHVHRYLFVMARLNKDAVKPPELATLPELPAKADSKTDAPADTAAKDGKAEGDKDGKKDGAKKDEAKKDDAKADEKDAKQDDDAAKEKKSDSADSSKADEKGEKKDDEAAKKDDNSAKELDKIIAERKQIEQENQRKLDEYQALLKKGEETVKDLNLRFGDWYFVVNDDVFQKVRISRDKAIKKIEKKEGEAAAPGGAAPPIGIPGLPSIPGAGKK